MKSEKFKINKGTKIEIVDALMKEFSLTNCQANTIVSFLIENKEFVSEKEVILADTHIDEQSGAAEFITDSMTYYVNIRKSTVYFLLFLLNLSNGISLRELVVDGIGIGLNIELSGHVLVNLENERGSKCLVIELAKHRKKGMSLKEILNLYGVNNKNIKECFNNHYCNCYNTDGYCEIKENRILELLSFLKDDGIVKLRFGRYYYRL